MFFCSLLLLIGQTLGGVSSQAQQPLSPNTVSQPASAVTGKVLTETGNPLPGVVVAIQGTSQVTSTNAAGDFLVMIPDGKSVLVFQYQGYRDQVLEASAGNTLLVKMLPVIGAGSAGTSSTSENKVAKLPDVVNYADEQPQFPGGSAAYGAFIRQNAVFPATALAHHASGTVFVSFVVDEQGRITNAEVVKGCGHGLDEEALRLVRIMPWWIPGKVAGKPVRVSSTVPIPFQYQENP